MNPDDPRRRRSRALIAATVRDLLTSRSAGGPLRFNDVASAADLSRSTLHSHYRSTEDMLVDALLPELEAMSAPAAGCPFEAPGVPDQVLALFRAAAEAAELLARLDQAERAAVAAALARRLEATLLARGRSRVSARERTAARFAAGGLAQLLIESDGTRPAVRAGRAWPLLRAAMTA